MTHKRLQRLRRYSRKFTAKKALKQSIRNNHKAIEAWMKFARSACCPDRHDADGQVDE